MKLHLVRIIKTCNEELFKSYKEIDALFDRVFVLDFSEEKEVSKYIRKTNHEIIEAEYREKNKKITDILNADEDGWIMVINQDEVFEKQSIQRIRRELETINEYVVSLYEVEERKVLGLHTSKHKEKLFKMKKGIEYHGHGKVKLGNEYLSKTYIREEYIKVEDKNKLNFELKKLAYENIKKERAEILRRNKKEREAMVIYETILKSTSSNDTRKEMMNELMLIYLENNQFKKIEELVETYYTEDLFSKEFHYLLVKYATKVEAYEEAIQFLSTINKQKENQNYVILENNKINNLFEKYELAKSSFREDFIIKTVIENIEQNNDTLEMHVSLNKLVMKTYGIETFKNNLKEMYQTEEEKKMMYNVLNEMGLYQEYEKEIREHIKELENGDIAKMYTSQFNEQGRKQAVEFSKIHSRKIHALIYNLKNKNLEIQGNIFKEKTLEMLFKYLEKPYIDIEKRKYKKHFYVKLLKEFVRIKNKEMEQRLLDIIDEFETATYKDIADMYIDEYDYEKAVFYLENYTLTNRQDKTEAKKLARLYKKIGKTEDYARILIRVLKQEPYNKYLVEELLETIEKQVINAQEKEKIQNEIQRIVQQEQKKA